jgi:hypothetical protein
MADEPEDDVLPPLRCRIPRAICSPLYRQAAESNVHSRSFRRRLIVDPSGHQPIQSIVWCHLHDAQTLPFVP